MEKVPYKQHFLLWYHQGDSNPYVQRERLVY